MKKIILHFDMNSYFASVEQQANPFLRGKPVGVCATLTQQGCIIASSREAKAFGVKTGCRVDEALRLCPDIRLVEVDPAKYRTTTQRIIQICREYTDDLELYSIDEGFLDFTGRVDSLEQVMSIAQMLQQRIQAEVGEWLHCSIGIAWTRWLAKFAGDTAPKGQIISLTPDMLPAYLRGRDVQEAWGIASATASRLACLGITTLDQLATASVMNLMQVFGIRGYELWANVNGIALGSIETQRQPKSIGHSHVLRARTRDLAYHKGILLRLCERTGRRLRGLGLEAFGIYAHARLDGQKGLGGGQKLGSAIVSTRAIFQWVWQQLGTATTFGMPTMYAIGVFNLRPCSGQLSLFAKPKPVALVRALDELNNKYGEETVVEGELVRLGSQHAPDRIGFRKTVGLDEGPLSEGF